MFGLRKRRLPLAGRMSLAMTGFLASAGIHSAPWEFGATIDLAGVYTDNILLTEGADQQSETIYSISPIFSASTDGDRLEADFQYSPQANFYKEFSDADQVYHSLDASLVTTIVRDAVFVYASATKTQSIVTPDASIPTTNIPITANRIDARVLELRPYWQQDLGFANLLAEVSYFDIKYDELDETEQDFYQNNDEKRINFSLDNYERQQGLAWGVAYRRQAVEYEEALPWKYQRATASLGFWINGSLRLFASGGAETAFDNILAGDMDDTFWEGGFQYRPNPRVDIELAAGERSFGESYRGRLSYEYRRGTTSISYSEEPSTLGQAIGNVRPIRRDDNIDELLGRPGATDRFLRKRGEWSTTVGLAKSNLSFRFLFEQREQRSTDAGLPLTDEDYVGGAVRWTWDIGSRSTFSASTDYFVRETQAIDSELTRYAMDYAYRFAQRLSIVFLVQRSQEEGRVSSAGDYTENQFRITLRTEF